MPKKRTSRKWEVPSSELLIHGQVQSWHVLMVSHDRMIEVPRDRAQYEENRLYWKCCGSRQRRSQDHATAA